MKQHTNIRMEKALKNELTEEAVKDKRSFTNYVEMLLATHPERKKTPSESKKLKD